MIYIYYRWYIPNCLYFYFFHHLAIYFKLSLLPLFYSMCVSTVPLCATYLYYLAFWYFCMYFAIYKLVPCFCILSNFEINLLHNMMYYVCTLSMYCPFLLYLFAGWEVGLIQTFLGKIVKTIYFRISKEHKKGRICNKNSLS